MSTQKLNSILSKRVPIEDILQNPNRDFIINPYKDSQLNSFIESLPKEGISYAFTVRKSPTNPSKYELQWGHHRLEAAKRLGWKTFPITVQDLTDDEMITGMVTENSKQRGGDGIDRITNNLEAVAVAARRLAYAVLKWPSVAGIPATQPLLRRAFGEDLDKNIPINENSFSQARNAILNGGIIGWRVIGNYLGEKTLLKQEIIDSIATLKSTGFFEKMIKEVSAQVEEELQAEKLQQERLQLEQENKIKESKRQENARLKTEKERDEHLKNLAKRINAEASSDPKLDPQVIPFFPTAFALNEFRKEVTNPAYEQYYPLHSQLDLIKKISQDFEADEQKEKEKNTKYIPKLAKESLPAKYIENKLKLHCQEYRQKNFLETQNTPHEDTSFTLKSVMQLLSNSRQALALAQTSITIVNKDKHEMSITAILAIHEIATEAYQTWLAVTNKLQSEVVTSPSIRVVK